MELLPLVTTYFVVPNMTRRDIALVIKNLFEFYHKFLPLLSDERRLLIEIGMLHTNFNVRPSLVRCPYPFSWMVVK